MNIAIDIDDTLTESFDYFIPYVAEYFDADVEELRKKNISYSNLPEEWKKHEVEFGKKYYDHVVADTPFKKDASYVVKKLHELGHKIIIITGRTDAFYTDPYKTTMQELKNGNIYYDKLICTLDKSSACIAENISILIDDLPANCKDAMQHGIQVLLFTSKGNRDADTDLVRVENWLEAFSVLKQIEEVPLGITNN